MKLYETPYKHISFFTILFLSTLLIGCDGRNMQEKKDPFPPIKDIPTSLWKKLAQKKIYFGHRSVGNNIIDGIWNLMKEHNEIRLDIVETIDPSDLGSAFFAHSKIGKNGNPKSKIDVFVQLMEKNIGDKIDIAFFKFCFADINAKTEIHKVFADYQSLMALLKKKYPKTTFLHVTVPLVATKATWKTWIKKGLKKKFIWEYDHNVARNKYNELVRKEYEGNEPIFDLATIESTYPNGKRAEFKRNGKRYYSLVPNYTNDGGHLNATSRKKAAEQLLILLTNLSE